MSELRELWDGKMMLGEGPVWHHAKGVLWFVDIKRRAVHRFDPRDNSVASWEAPAMVGWVLPSTKGRILAGLQTGLALFDPANGSFDPVCAVEPDLPANRLNDATVAQDGTVWFGSMDDDEKQASGRYYRWTGGSLEAVDIDPVIITNGPALSPDQRTLYHVDTAGGTVYASTLDESHNVSSTRVFATIDPADGHPDGCVVDALGNVWLALWGGWRARLYDPAGKIMREVRLPVSNVTKIALGGRDFKTAYVTTARAGLCEEELDRQPLAGGLFAFRVDTAGRAVPIAKI